MDLDQLPTIINDIINAKEEYDEDHTDKKLFQLHKKIAHINKQFSEFRLETIKLHKQYKVLGSKRKAKLEEKLEEKLDSKVELSAKSKKIRFESECVEVTEEDDFEILEESPKKQKKKKRSNKGKRG